MLEGSDFMFIYPENLKAKPKLWLWQLRDISIIGIDDMPMCELMDPPLTTMHVPKHQMGVQAVKRLLEKINSNSREILTIEIRTSLVERQSIRTVKG